MASVADDEAGDIAPRFAILSGRRRTQHLAMVSFLIESIVVEP
jgi:hypothetical protein